MWNIQTFTEIPSTQKLALEKLQAGEAEHGDVFAAMHQTEGRGRYSGRIWHDEYGANLLMSVVLIDVPPHLQNKMQFVASLSVLHTIRTQLSTRIRKNVEVFDPSGVRLKWPNDILLDNKKTAGILVDAIWSGEALKGIVVGIGVNINQDFFSDELSSRATSMRKFTDEPVPVDRTRSLVLSSLQFSLEYYSPERFISELTAELEWMHDMDFFSITEADGTKTEGLRYEGITADGALIMHLPSGERKIFQNGSLHFV